MRPQQYKKITVDGIRGLILAALDTGSNAWVGDIAMKMTSDQENETYAWLGNVPGMREFIGGRTPKEISENSFTISNKDYETTLAFRNKDVRHDKLGMIKIRIGQLVERALDHPAKLLTSLLLAGASALCYDGQYFFDTDHSEGSSGTQSNSITSAAVSTTVPTVDEMAKAIMAALQAVIGFKDDQGEPMNQSATAFQVQVPVTFMATALEAVTALLGTGGKSNTLPALKGKFTVDVVVNPRLTWTTKIAVLRTDSAAKPFILQEEMPADADGFGETSEYAKEHGKQLYWVDWSGNVGYAYWQHACLVTFV